MKLADLVISSSWVVENGWTTQIGGKVVKQPKSKRLRFKRVTCSSCGEVGHLRTTCGLTPEERTAKRKARPRKPTASSQLGPQPGAPVEQPQGEPLLVGGEGLASEGGAEEEPADVGHGTAPSCEAV